VMTSKKRKFGTIHYDDRVIFRGSRVGVIAERNENGISISSLSLLCKKRERIIFNGPDNLKKLNDFVDSVSNDREPEFTTKFGDKQLSVIPDNDKFKMTIITSPDQSETFSFRKSDLKEFNKFLNYVDGFITDLLRHDYEFCIWDATRKYISEMLRFRISDVIETIITELGCDVFGVWEYPGVLPLSADSTPNDIRQFKKARSKTMLTDIFKIDTTKRYNVGIFSIDGGGDHYLTFVLDTQEKTAWLFDSLRKNAMDRDGIITFVRTLFPGYSISGLNISSGCGKFEPLFSDTFLIDEEYVDQNIFCHTWSLWFIYQVVRGVKDGWSISTIISYINKACKTPRENLIRIKKFAAWLTKNILEVQLPPEFGYIYNPSHIIETGEASCEYEVVELNRDVEYVIPTVIS
jgi:hypothetical protein